VPSETQTPFPPLSSQDPASGPTSGPRRSRRLAPFAGIALALLLVVACARILPSVTPSLFPSGTPAPTEPGTATPGLTATFGPTGPETPVPTPSDETSPSVAPTATPDPSATGTPTGMPTLTPGPTPTRGPTPTPGPTKTPAPTATRGPTPTPRPTSTPAPTATPRPTVAATLFAGTYTTFYRDDYGTSQNVTMSDDGLSSVDIGKTDRGLAVVWVSDTYATDPTIRIKVLVYKQVNGVYNSACDYQYTILKRGQAVGIPLQLGNGNYKLAILIRRDPARNAYNYLITKEFAVTLDSSLSPYLAATSLSDFSRSSTCVAKAKTLCSGLSGTAKVDAVYKWIIANIAYDTTLANNINNGTVTVWVPDPDRTLANKKGICFDYSSLFSSMLRSQGIPARLVIGDFIKSNADGSTYNVRHAWNEVYYTGQGWVVVNGFQWQNINGQGWTLLDSTFGHSVSSQQIKNNIDGGKYVTFEYY
jgi:hypothetical protein